VTDLLKLYSELLLTDVVHLICRSVADNAQDDLQLVVDSLFSSVDNTGYFHSSFMLLIGVH